MRVVFATGNAGKVREVKAILADLNMEVLSMKEAGVSSDADENGSTFAENAVIKATDIAKKVPDAIVMADDSGLVVDALNGEPGIYSARYAGDGVDKHNNELLLKNMQGVENRKAKFVCCMVFYKPNGEIISAFGETQGEIMDKEYGENGFGYDPLFFSHDLNQCLGLASAEDKNKISHRFRAISALKDKLK